MGLRNPISELLLDSVTWEWQSVEELFANLIPKIPPGQAIREYKKIREQHEQQRDRRREQSSRAGAERPPLDTAAQIRSGARGLLNTALTHLKDGEYAEVQGERAERQIRRKDRRAELCPKCGGEGRAASEPMIAFGVLEATCNHEEEITRLKILVAGLKEELREQETLYEKVRQTAFHNSSDGKLVAQEQLVKRQYVLISELTEALRKMVWHQTVPKGQWDAEWRKAAMLVETVDGQKKRANVG